MATLSKDGKTSWHARGVVKRDARATHAGPEESVKATTKPKDTKRWCLGKVGREHGFEVEVSHREMFPRLIAFCRACGKEFGVWTGGWSGDRTPPTWATPEHLKALEQAKQERDAKRRKDMERAG
jgi:hypothetical protein